MGTCSDGVVVGKYHYDNGDDNKDGDDSDNDIEESDG